MNAYIGVLGVYVRTLATVPTECIAHRILDAQRDKIQTFERTTHRREIHPYGIADTKPLRPVKRERSIVNIGFCRI